MDSVYCWRFYHSITFILKLLCSDHHPSPPFSFLTKYSPPPLSRSRPRSSYASSPSLHPCILRYHHLPGHLSSLPLYVSPISPPLPCIFTLSPCHSHIPLPALHLAHPFPSSTHPPIRHPSCPLLLHHYRVSFHIPHHPFPHYPISFPS